MGSGAPQAGSFLHLPVTASHSRFLLCTSMSVVKGRENAGGSVLLPWAWCSQSEGTSEAGALSEDSVWPNNRTPPNKRLRFVSLMFQPHGGSPALEWAARCAGPSSSP